MVFYAYSKTTQNDAYYRYLITAPTMEVLDEWYRAIQKKLPAGTITRISPEFYIHDQSKVDLGRCTWTGNNVVPEFMNRITFTLLNDVGGRELSTFYNKHVVDHTNKNSFFIRSKSDPSVFWYEYGGEIYAIPDGRTKFRIVGRDMENDVVLIKGDSISIAPVTNRDKFVSVDKNGTLVLDGKGADFKFGELKYGFLSTGNGPSRKVTRVSDDGEEWELVS